WLIAHYPSQSARWQRPDVIGLIGVVTLIPCGASLVWLKTQSDAATVLLLLLVLIWAADIGAYFVGRRFGQRKLLPNVSPGKSVEGLVGGLLIAVIAGFATLELMPKVDGRALGYAGWLWLFLGIGLISVLGDLTLSMFKRSRGIKDSSQLLPGHGGFLDRLDSVFSAAPIYCGLLYLTASLK
ncbi:phosphatidate cytidylyltransferase, partial [Pseudomonadales bacterium]|nr:phosphatidate cytidylyltransferase [Pseudomonadales bacterium]